MATPTAPPTPPRTENPVVQVLQDVLQRVRGMPVGGAVADYIPELATADPALFGIAVTSVAGRLYAAGDASTPFTVQSISKPFVYALVLAEHGVDATLQHVGVEPSGEAFNAISFDAEGRPANPMINAGAIVATSLVPGSDGDERFERIRTGLSAFAGHPLAVDEAVYESESSTGDRNRALAMLARSTGVLGSAVDDAVEPYFRQCALQVDAADLAVMAATLGNHGVNPVTGHRAIADEVAVRVLSVMASAGMYDRSGLWTFQVGMPAKSGVGGGILAVAPGQYGVGVFSPPLDAAGNSSRGVAALRLLSEEFGLHMFRHPWEPASPVQEIRTDDDTATVTVVVRGVLDFDAAEEVVHRAATAAAVAQATTLMLDLSAVTAVRTVAALLLRALRESSPARGYTVTTTDPDGVLNRPRR